MMMVAGSVLIVQLFVPHLVTKKYTIMYTSIIHDNNKYIVGSELHVMSQPGVHMPTPKITLAPGT